MKLSKQFKEDLRSYLKDRMENREVVAQIIAPYELSQDEIAQIKSKVPLIKHAKIEVVLDETILAGFVIKFGSKLIDYSLKSKIESLFHAV